MAHVCDISSNPVKHTKGDLDQKVVTFNHLKFEIIAKSAKEYQKCDVKILEFEITYFAVKIEGLEV